MGPGRLGKRSRHYPIALNATFFSSRAVSDRVRDSEISKPGVSDAPTATLKSSCAVSDGCGVDFEVDREVSDG